MVSRTIPRRLDALQHVADKIKPCRMIVTFADGSEVVTAPADTWDICLDNAQRADVVSIIADCPEYAAAARIMTILCHPAEDRRIENYV